MASKEATARIKINRLLEEAGWRFFDDAAGPANIVLEPNVKLKGGDIDALGEDFEKTKNGFVDFLLLDVNGKPLIVLEAKSEDIHRAPGSRRFVGTRERASGLKPGKRRGPLFGALHVDHGPGAVLDGLQLAGGDQVIGAGAADAVSVAECADGKKAFHVASLFLVRLWTTGLR